MYLGGPLIELLIKLFKNCTKSNNTKMDVDVQYNSIFLLSGSPFTSCNAAESWRLPPVARLPFHDLACGEAEE